MKASKLAPWRYYLGLMRLPRSRLALSVFLLVLNSFLYFPVVLLARFAFVVALPNRDWNNLLTFSLAMLVSLIVISSVGIWARRQALAASKSIVEQFRHDLLARVSSFSRKRYTLKDMHQLRFTIVVETDRLETMNFVIFTQILPGLFGGTVLGLILLYINWQLVLIFIVTFPLIGIAGNLFRNKIALLHQKFIKTLREFGAEVSLMTSLLDLIHLQSTEEEELRKRQEKIEEMGQSTQELQTVRMLFTEIQYFSLITIVLVILVAGSYAVIQGDIDTSELAIFYAVLGLFITIIRPIWSTYSQVVTGGQSLATLYDVLIDEDKPVYPGKGRLDFKGKVNFEDVRFGYGENSILNNFNLSISSGEKIALIGPNGIGKTTILHLLLGYYRPTKGQIFADGIAYATLDMRKLRAQMGVVTQNSLLWPGTLWENLTYGNSHLPRADVLEACRIAYVEDFAVKLPDAYEAIIGEQGTLLSGGQRKRIEIARALMRKPPLLLLDEPTGHLDKKIRHRVLETISNLPYKPTIVIISHDKSVLGYVDSVYDFDEVREGIEIAGQ